MNFLIDFNKKNMEKVLTYLPDEFSFDMEPAIYEINCYVLLNKIDLAIDENNCIVHLSGFCPYTAWVKTHLKVPNYRKGTLEVKNQLEPGFSYRINDYEWPVYINDRDEWICIGNPEKKGEAVEFLSGCVAVIYQEKLESLWLDPKKGKVTHCETYQLQSNLRNPNPWESIKRYDGSGKDHRNKIYKQELRHPTFMILNGPGEIRYPEFWELPK
jgi:hypothetical protein